MILHGKTFQANGRRRVGNDRAVKALRRGVEHGGITIV